MSRIIRQLRSPSGLIAALAVLVLAVATLPLFGSTAYAAGLTLQNTVSRSQFVIPGGPGTKISVEITAAATAPMLVSVADNISTLFPKAGEIVISGTEVMVYDNNSAAAACAGRTKLQFCVTARAKVGAAELHTVPLTGAATAPFDKEGRVKLATQLTSVLGITAQTTMTNPASISAILAPPFLITLAGTRAALGFPDSGEITISHADTATFTPASELMRYNISGAADNQLNITARALNANNVAVEHKKTGYASACTANNAITCPQLGVTNVTLHTNATVKAAGTTGFFPASPLIIYEISGGAIINAELVTQVRGPAATKLTAKAEPSLTGDTFRLVGRGGATALFETDTAIQSHPANSVVTWPDSQLMCRARNEQPFDSDPNTAGVQDPNDPAINAGSTIGTSVGVFSVCYTRTQPGAPPKDFSTNKLDVPLEGQPLILLNALGQPFLSTGGFAHLLYGAVPQVDNNGTTDGTLVLTSPCIIDFTPGTNLKVDVTIPVDKFYQSADTGTIKVVLDTIHDTPNSATSGNLADNCDDQAGTGDIILNTYIHPVNGTEAAKPPVDLDLDGCTDNRELFRSAPSGGRRDAWNPWDFFDPDIDPLTGAANNKTIALGNVLNVAGRFGASGSTATAYNKGAAAGTYNRAFDRGPTLGPNPWNTSQPDGTITLGNVLAIAAQFGHGC
ncbi:MAG: hypothetical protein HY723_05865 [Chloroflexi bacterium]|nr:hypothetical protein [Chloroflexota bacterium]